jgi:hypothetical protein
MHRRAWSAFLVLLLAACGSVKRGDDGADGAPPGTGADSGAPDGPVADAPPATGEASIEVRLGGAPTPGVPVVFHGPDGGVAAEATTDSTGTASATIGRDGMITVATSVTNLLTIDAVQPGDRIVLATPPALDDTDISDIVFSSAQEAPGKFYYRADMGADLYVTVVDMVGGGRLSLSRAVLDQAGQFHLVAGVYSAVDALIGYSFLSDITPVIGGTTTISLPVPWRTDIRTITTSIAGAPAEAEGENFEVETANRLGELPFMNSSFAGLDRAPITGGAASVSTVYLGSFGDSVETTARLSLRGGPVRAPLGFLSWTRRSPLPATGIALGDADMPPRLSPSLGREDPARPALSWDLAGNASGGDASIVDLQYANGTTGRLSWRALVPPDATTFTFPDVAERLAGQAPGLDSTVSLARVIYTDLEPLAGYDAFRAAPPIGVASSSVLPPGFERMVQSEGRAPLE